MVIPASTAEQIELVRALMIEYARAMGENVAHSSIGKDLADGLVRYSPPKGRLLLALTEDETPVGIAALSYIDDDTCELKRVYVKEILRGDGLGTALSKAALRHARWIGYRRAVLSVYRTNAAAVALYRKLGFTDVAPFKTSDIERELLFMGFDLTGEEVSSPRNTTVVNSQ
jgi:ribosomal protein S18 acetylase RimI-like enzyme